MAWYRTPKAYEGESFNEYGEMDLPYYIIGLLDKSPQPLDAKEITAYLQNDPCIGDRTSVERSLRDLYKGGYIEGNK